MLHQNQIITLFYDFFLDFQPTKTVNEPRRRRKRTCKTKTQSKIQRLSGSHGQRTKFDLDDAMSDKEDTNETERFKTHQKGRYFRKSLHDRYLHIK